MTQYPNSIAYSADCEQIQLSLAEGYCGQGRFFESAGPRRAVLYLHGIQSHSGWFLRSAERLHQQGAAVLMPDRRGSGLNQTDRGHCASARQLVDDMAAGADWLAEKTGLEQLDLLAVSWGGKLALAYAGRCPERVRSITLVAPGLCPHGEIDITLKEKISVGLNGIVRPHNLHPIPLTKPKLFTDNEPMKRFIAHDPLMLREATASFFIASTRLDLLARRALGRIEAPVHLFLAEYERIIDNAATINLLRAVLRPGPGGSEAAKIYPQAHHTLEFEADPREFLADLAAVIND